MPQEWVEYRDKKVLDKEMKYGRDGKAGWKVVSISDTPQRSGVVRYAALGLGALVLKPKSKIYALWEKAD